MTREMCALLFTLCTIAHVEDVLAQVTDSGGDATSHTSPLTSHDEARYRRFTQELRCLVCQNQNIADSNAPLANDLREQVRAQILAGRSDAEITRYVTDRYGDFVLYNPPLKASTVALWLLPFVLLLGALTAAWRYARRGRTPAAPAPVDEAALKHLLDDKP